MTVEQSAAARPRPVPTAERLAAEEPIAHGHEHGRALAAARTLAERLELTGTHDVDCKVVQELIRRLSEELVGGPPCQRFGEEDGVTLDRVFKEKARVDDTQYISADSQKRIDALLVDGIGNISAGDEA